MWRPIQRDHNRQDSRAFERTWDMLASLYRMSSPATFDWASKSYDMGNYEQIRSHNWLSKLFSIMKILKILKPLLKGWSRFQRKANVNHINNWNETADLIVSKQQYPNTFQLFTFEEKVFFQSVFWLVRSLQTICSAVWVLVIRHGVQIVSLKNVNHET